MSSSSSRTRGGYQRVGIGYGAQLGGGFVHASEAAQRLTLDGAGGGDEVGPLRGCQDSFGRFEGRVEAAVADLGVAEQHADLGLRLGAGLIEEGLEQCDGARVIAGGDGGLALEGRVALRVGKGTEGRCRKGRERGWSGHARRLRSRRWLGWGGGRRVAVPGSAQVLAVKVGAQLRAESGS